MELDLHVSRFDWAGGPSGIGPDAPPVDVLGRIVAWAEAARASPALLLDDAARTVRWREASILLEVHENGRGVNATHPDLLMTEMANSANSTGGHHGLQGMRERAAALGGEVTSGPIDTGGFTVTLRLPFEASSVISAQKVAYRE